jgi:hypothetical protein
MTKIDEDEKIEKIGHTAELIRYDLLKCGKVMRETAGSEIIFLTNSDTSLLVISGITGELIHDVNEGETTIYIKRKASFKKGKQIFIFDRENRKFEINEIQAVAGGKLILQEELQGSYSKDSYIAVLRKVEYKYDSKKLALKRKVDNGYFKTLLKDVTEFFVRYFPEHNSVLYRIELEKKEQMRGYIFLDKVDKTDGTDGTDRTDE